MFGYPGCGSTDRCDSLSDSPPYEELTATIVSLFSRRVSDDGTRRALYRRRGDQFEPLTWNDFAADVRQTAAAPVGLGVAPGDRVVQVSENRYEWIVLDLAIHLAQACM